MAVFRSGNFTVRTEEVGTFLASYSGSCSASVMYVQVCWTVLLVCIIQYRKESQRRVEASQHVGSESILHIVPLRTGPCMQAYMRKGIDRWINSYIAGPYIIQNSSIRFMHSLRCKIGRNKSACRSLRRCSSSIIHREVESSESTTTLHDCRYRKTTATSSKAI